MNIQEISNSAASFALCAGILAVIGYALGCISTGYLVGKKNHVDIRKEGSGNSGTTNALRTLGKKAGLITFLGDLLKAVVPVVAVRIIFREDAELAVLLELITGLGVVLGHNFPCWLHFKGGKGIAVTAGVIISIADWRVIVIGLALFILLVAATRYVSVGSLMVAWILPINAVIFYRDSRYFTADLVISIIFMVLAYIRHSSNIKRLLNGTENKLGQKKEAQQ